MKTLFDIQQIQQFDNLEFIAEARLSLVYAEMLYSKLSELLKPGYVGLMRGTDATSVQSFLIKRKKLI